MERAKYIFLSALFSACLAQAANVQIVIGDVYASGSASLDSLHLDFDDSLGATNVPYWLNGFTNSRAMTGYVGTIRSTNFSYASTVYLAIDPGSTFYLFEECSLAVNCYLSLGSPTNAMTQQKDPTQPGQLGEYLMENLSLLGTLVGPNGGWNIAVNSPSTFPVNSLVLNTVKVGSIQVSSVPEPSGLAIALLGLLVLVAVKQRSVY